MYCSATRRKEPLIIACTWVGATANSEDSWLGHTVGRRGASDGVLDIGISASPCEIIDVGCGAGFLSNALSEQGFRVTGVDLSQESLTVAQRHDSREVRRVLDPVIHASYSSMLTSKRESRMPILAIFTSPAITKQNYDDLRREIGWEVSRPSGGIFHVAGFDEAGGIHVADVWESAKALNQFVSSRLMPAMQKLNLASPSVEVFPVHNATAYPAVDVYKVKIKPAAKKPKATAKAKAKKRSAKSAK